MEITSVNKEFNLNFDIRITKGEKEVSKRRADIFFRFKQGEFIVFADGKDKRVQYELQRIQKIQRKPKIAYSNHELKLNYEKIYRNVKHI